MLNLNKIIHVNGNKRQPMHRPSPIAPAALSSAAGSRRVPDAISFTNCGREMVVLLLLFVVCKSAELSAPAGGSNSVANATIQSVVAADRADDRGRVVIGDNAIHTASDDDDNDGDNDDDVDKRFNRTLELITTDCRQRCISEEHLYLDEFGIQCARGDSSDKCYRARCTKGCESWWSALKELEPCQEACSTTQFHPYDLPCIAACEIAQSEYWQRQRLICEPFVRATRPQLLNDSLTANSLTLQWSIALPDNYLAIRPYNIQYQYATGRQNRSSIDGAADLIDEGEGEQDVDQNEDRAWYNLADYNCNENFDCEIMEGLVPYTSYRFRFELPFGDSTENVLHSPATSVFTTLAEGAPISETLISHAFAMDHSHVAVFWQKGQFSNGPMKHYRLVLQNPKENTTFEEIVPYHIKSYVFSNLLPSVNYTIQIAMVNEEGEGPFAITTVVTADAAKPYDLFGEFNSVLIAGEYTLKLKSFEALTDTRVLYESKQPIRDYVLLLAGQRLFVVHDAGQIYSVFLGNTNTTQSIPAPLNGTWSNFAPQKITVDWLNQQLYTAGPTDTKAWAVAVSDYEGNAAKVMVANLTDVVLQLEIDPINGWLFYTQATGLSRVDLATGAVQEVVRSPQLGYFTVDFNRNLLIAYNKSDGELYEFSYDGAHTQRVVTNITTTSTVKSTTTASTKAAATATAATTTTTTTSTLTSTMATPSRYLQGELRSFAQLGGLIFIVTNGTHILRQNYQTNENDILPIRELKWCWDLAPLMQPLQPQTPPVPSISPGGLQALLTSNMAKITWLAPTRTPYQTDYAWRQWEYELEILDVASNSAFNIRNIKTTYFNVEKLQANNLYRLRVRCASRSAAVSEAEAGPWSEELLTRTWPLGEHRFLWAVASGSSGGGGDGGLYETNEIGANAVRLGELEKLGRFVQLNGTIFYVGQHQGQGQEPQQVQMQDNDKEKDKDQDQDQAQDNRLQCANIMNPEVNCSFVATNVQSLSYDWRGGKVYWTDKLRRCVLRANLDGTQRELLQIFAAQDIEIDAINGHLYYTTGTRLARRTLSGTFPLEEVEYFHVNGFGGSIRGFAVNVQQQQLYWIVREHEGKVRLFKGSLERSRKGLESKLLAHDVEPGSLKYVQEIESIMWLELHTSRAVLMRTNLKDLCFITHPEWKGVNYVQLKSHYTPFSDLSVISEAVNVSSIRIDDGYWDDFYIKWSPATTAENHTIFYKVLLEYAALKKARFYTMEVLEPAIRITEFHQPDLLLNITITPHTYWYKGESVSTQLCTPSAAPTQPKRLRVFVQRIDRPLQPGPNITAVIRWDPPENVTKESQISYKIYCWQDEELFGERLHSFSSERPLEASIGSLQDNLTYTFQVQAFAAGRTTGGEKTAYNALLIRSDTQAVPHLLYITNEFIAELDLDLNTRKILVHTPSEVEKLVVMKGEQRLLWVNEDVELISFIPGSVPVKLARMRAEVLALTVDWIARIVYWAEVDSDLEDTVSMFRLDLCQFEGRVMLGTKIFSTTKGHLVKDLLVLPFSQTLLWLEYRFGERNATLHGRNLTAYNELGSDWNVMESVERMFVGSRTEDEENVILVDGDGGLCVYNVERHKCTFRKRLFDMDNDSYDDIDRDAGFAYVLKNDSIRAYNMRKNSWEFQAAVLKVKSIRAYHVQHYPDRQCLLPDDVRELPIKVRFKPHASHVDEHSMVVDMPAVNSNRECRTPIPGVKYSLMVWNNRNFTRNFTTHGQFVNITDLEPYTEYSVQLVATSYYQLKHELPSLRSDVLTMRTSAGTPSEPRNFTVYALSPTEIQVNWAQPSVLNSDKVYYQLHWNVEASGLKAHKQTEDTSMVLNNLEASQEYTIYLKVCSSPDKCNITSSTKVSTYEKPAPLLLVNKTAYNLTLSWKPSGNLTRAIIVCHALNNDNEFSIDITENSTFIMVQELEPKTKYELFLQLSYDVVERPYIWPEVFSKRFVFETYGTRPSQPGQPQIEHITGEIFKVFWDAAQSNGAPVLEYSLEALQLRSPKRIRRDAATTAATITAAEQLVENKTLIALSQLPWAEEPRAVEDRWIVYCNTTELSCIVRELHTLRLLMFRVRARNEPYGWGSYSAESDRVLEPFVSPQKRDSLIFAIIAPAAIVSGCVIALVVVRLVRNRRMKAKKLLEKSRPSIWSNGSNLQQQQQLMASRNRTFSIASHSTLYTGGPLSDADIALLPHISWNQITLLKFLGSGAFGEVYEGLVKHEDECEEEKVAIKSLRKGASEFAELLQEAQLMSNFRHENIVRLIGVCCDAVSISIIMEHMEGGDLLTYLRESRPNSHTSLASLQILDLMTMCIDVATGCSYLEDMHFVHRDLACRNCLVSSRVASKRVVKIGDFGLARDIYKNDYYRKEGEGLLPVRWMSPESLIDGVFTTQSDVWAFAVLCWEILTLGQQPYAARNNFEVLNYVKEDGRLEQPDNCPDKLFSLMLLCWHTDPDMRPSFRKCLNTLLSIKTDVRRVSLGYNIDDGEYAMYANHHGVLMSSFLANTPPLSLSKVVEDPVEEPVVESVAELVAEPVEKHDTQAQEVGVTKEERPELRVRFINEIEIATDCDESQLIDKHDSNADDTHDGSYINEGVSRL